MSDYNWSTNITLNAVLRRIVDNRDRTLALTHYVDRGPLRGEGRGKGLFVYLLFIFIVTDKSNLWSMVRDSVVEFAHTPGVSISLIKSL